MTHNKIDHFRKVAGLTVEQLAREAGISRGYLNELKRGDKRLNVDVMRKLAKPLRIPPYFLSEGHNAKIPVLGEVGAGGDVFPIDHLPLVPGSLDLSEQESINCEWVDSPPGIYANRIVALRVTGKSMLPIIAPGAVIYYADRHEGGAPDDCLSRLCVVQTRQEKTLVKIVRRSHLHGKFDLLSTNMEVIPEIELAWCAPVIFIKPF